MTTPIRSRIWSSRWRWLLLTPIAAGLIFGIVSIATTPDRHELPGGDRDGADLQCRGQVLGKLRAPGTAQFTGATVAYRPGQTADFYTARGQVDAQNGFGALLRMRYQCDLTQERDLSWRVTTVVVG